MHKAGSRMACRFRLLAAMLVSLSACEAASQTPTPFDLRQPIPLGMLSIAVMRTETVPNPPFAPISSLMAQPGEKVVAVFVRWKGLEDLDQADQRVFIETFLEDRLSIVDEDGETYPAFSAMPLDIYQMSPGGYSPHDWVAVFHVWVDSQRYTVLVANPQPEAGGFTVAAIPLQ